MQKIEPGMLDPGPPSCPYSPNVLEEKVSEVRGYILRPPWPAPGWIGPEDRLTDHRTGTSSGNRRLRGPNSFRARLFGW
jgi:hypothetical protein